MNLKLCLLIFATTAWLAGCGAAPVASTNQHLTAESAPSVAGGDIPPPIRAVPLPPPPKASAKAERYTVVVNAVPVQELLFALARDAKVNVDVHPGVEGTVTLNAINQTLPQILSRIAKQVDMRFETDGPNLVVMPDAPYLKNYKIDYVNMTRDTTETISLATQIATTGTGSITGAGGGQSATGNNSTTSVTNTSKNRFWETLIQNVKDILRETDKVFPEGSYEAQTAQTGQQRGATTAPNRSSRRPSRSSAATTPAPTGDTTAEQTGELVETRFTFREAASVIANAESGVLNVRATSRQHEKVQEFIDQVMGSARRQVLIEATIVEVNLNDNYQAGVDWGRLVDLGKGQLTLTQQVSPSGFNIGGTTVPALTLSYIPNGSSIASTIKLLSDFGTTRVLSSPKVMVLNNQSAVMKVVDNRVYFTVQAQTTSLNQNSTQVTFSSTPISVPIGFVMNVTPQISQDDVVSINVRPTISRITGFVNDPNPDLKRAGVVNAVPEIQTREIESVLKVTSGQIAIMGGLMQDNVATDRTGVPLLSRIPFVGDAFSYRNDTTAKTELVIFLRPTVIREASINADLKSVRSLLPDERFLNRSESELLPRGATGLKP
jgi:MSHA biogenesis protein MshL